MEHSLYSRYKSGEITLMEYYNQLAIKRGFNSYADYQKHLRDTKGFKTQTEYQDHIAIKNGYNGWADYQLQRSHRLGIRKPLSENKECAQWLGIHISERVLSNIFEHVERMPINNIGFDFICKKGYKIDVKSACIRSDRNAWNFGLNNNSIADYFLLLAFDNRNDLNPKHIWLLKNNDSINRINITISNSDRVLNKWKRYEQTDKLEQLIACCDVLKHNGGD